MQLETLVHQFQERTLPHESWNHHAHLGVALWTLRHCEFEQGLEQLRSGIRAYNESVGVENGSFSGYHETITRFFALAVRQFLHDTDENDPDTQWSQLIEIWGEKNAIFRYYSRRHLFYPGSRAQFSEPDLRLLDFEATSNLTGREVSGSRLDSQN